MKETPNEWRPFVFPYKRQTDGLTELNLKLAGGLPLFKNSVLRDRREEASREWRLTIKAEGKLRSHRTPYQSNMHIFNRSQLVCVTFDPFCSVLSPSRFLYYHLTSCFGASHLLPRCLPTCPDRLTFLCQTYLCLVTSLRVWNARLVSAHAHQVLVLNKGLFFPQMIY